MSMLAIVTFDLHGANPNLYKPVQQRLSGLRLNKKMRGKHGHLSKLPANTFVAKFSGHWSSKGASALRMDISKKVRGVMKQMNLHATIFVAIGDNWSWGKFSER